MNQSLSALPPGVRLGVSPLSWANDVLEDLGANISLETCLTDAAEVGYQGVELRGLLEPRGLVLASGWHSGELAERGVDAEMAAVALHASLLRDMGSTVMVYGEVAMMTPGAPLDAPMSKRLVMPDDAVADYASRLTEFSKRLLGQYGLRLAYHHHLMMVAETFDEVSALFDKARSEVGLLLDTGHAVGAGFDYALLFERFGDRIAHVHLKDVRNCVMEAVRIGDLSFNEAVRNGMFTVPGDGDVKFAPVADFVNKGGYQGWLIIEAEPRPGDSSPETRRREGVQPLPWSIEVANGSFWRVCDLGQSLLLDPKRK